MIKVPKVFYSLSEYGKTVIPLTETIVQWGLGSQNQNNRIKTPLISGVRINRKTTSIIFSILP